MIKYPTLYKQIYKKIKHISHNLNLTLNIEQSIKINNNTFNKSRYIFTLVNQNNLNYDIIQNNLSYIKNVLSLSSIPKFTKGFITEFIYAIDIFKNITKIYITVFNNNKTIIFCNIYKNHNFKHFFTRYYIHKNNFYNKYSNSLLLSFFNKYDNYNIIDNYYLIYQNNIFNAISFKTTLINQYYTKKFIFDLFKLFNLQIYNYHISRYLNKYPLYFLTNVTINNNLNEINLYFYI